MSTQQVYCTGGADCGSAGDDFFVTESGGGGTEGENDEAARLVVAEERRGALAEGGVGNLLVLASLGDHRLQKHTKENPAIANLASAYPDVLKVWSIKIIRA